MPRIGPVLLIVPCKRSQVHISTYPKLWECPMAPVHPYRKGEHTYFRVTTCFLNMLFGLSHRGRQMCKLVIWHTIYFLVKTPKDLYITQASPKEPNEPQFYWSTVLKELYSTYHMRGKYVSMGKSIYSSTGNVLLHMLLQDTLVDRHRWLWSR